MWKKAAPLLWTIALLGAGCANIETTATHTPPPVSTVASTPTPLPNPSATPFPEDTPVPALKTKGPYLVYFAGEQQRLILMDADGAGQKAIDLPAMSDESFLTARLVSPDGKWLAYYSGTAQQAKDSDLTLNLLNLETNETRPISKLLSKDYPDNFTQAAKDLNDPLITAETLQQTFLSGITHSIGWSPDARYLAFAGQTDGTSSDVYIYDTTDQSIRRLTHGPDEVLGVGWSPDGKWVMVSGEKYIGAGTGVIEDAISFNGKTDIPLPYRTGGRIWHNDHEYVIYDSQNVFGDHNLRLVDIQTGKIIKLWDGSFRSFCLDPEKALVLGLPLTRTLPPITENEPPPREPYLINLQNGKQTKLNMGKMDPDLLHFPILFFGLGDRRFFIKIQEEFSTSTHFISADGTLTAADPQLDNVSVAPDKQHWVSISETLKVFTADDTLVFDKALPFVVPSSTSVEYWEKSRLQTLWQPDSSGLFMAVDNEIYHLDLSNGEIKLVETSFIPEPGWFFTK